MVARRDPLQAMTAPYALVIFGSLAAYGAAALVRYQSNQTEANTGLAEGPNMITRGFVSP